MSYFPFVIQVEHLIEMRQYIADLHNSSFLNVFANISKERLGFVHVNIMGNYLWYFHREEYQWHALFKPGIYGWKPSPGQASKKYISSQFTEDMKVPFPRSSVHQRHFEDVNMRRSTAELITTGICLSGGLQLCPDVCKAVTNSTFHADLFKFHGYDWTWDKRCFQAQQLHYRNVNENYRERIKPQIEQGCRYLTQQLNQTKPGAA